MTRANTTDPMVGSVLEGRYEILARVARGGMATVYRALDLRLARTVAVKVMHDGLGDDADFAAKFDREARHAATLNNPHLVSVFDQGVDDGRPYIVMEYVQGHTLRHLLNRESPLPTQRMLEIAEAMASALATAHEAGLVHRDIKPENVLISERGEIKVADFGLARAVTAHTTTASQGLLIGTVSYLPPELLTTGRADARSDVYSTGVVMYEMLTGTKPHTGDTPIQVAWSHVHHDIDAPSLTRQARGVPDYVDALVVACTRRDADDRPHDGRTLLDRVRQARVAVAAGVTSDPELTTRLSVGSSPAAAAGSSPHDATAPARSSSAASGASPTGAESAMAASTSIPPRPVSPHPRSPSSAPSPNQPPSARPVEVGVRGDDRVVARPAGASMARSDAHLSGPVAATATITQLGGDSHDGSLPHSSTSTAPASVDTDDVHTVAVQRWAPRPRSQSTPIFPHISRDPVHRRRRWLVVVILVLILALIAGSAAYYYATRIRWTASPALLNMTQAQAQSVATNSGLQITFDDEYSETVAKGLVMKVDPPPGTRVLKGSSVHAVVSLGPERYPMPKVVGLTKDAAAAALTNGNLALGEVTSRHDEKVPSGVVLEASQAEGTALKKGTAVDLMVSLGPKPITIASWVGKSGNEARKALTALGFKVTVQDKHHDTVPKGRVISQSPSSGLGKKGDTIALVVSLGPVMVAVPKVTGLTEAAARAKLGAVGFKVSVKYNTAAWLRLDIVAGQDPSASKSLPKGSTVTIYIS